MTDLRHVDADELAGLLDGPAAVDVLEAALTCGRVDPEQDSARLFSHTPTGEFLMMPTVVGKDAGVKVVSIAPDNPRHGHPKIQGVYVLFEAAHMRPVATIDAVELTLVRTPATTVLAAKHLLRGGEVERVVVFGTGPQARRHARYVDQVLRPDEIVVVGRRPDAVESVVDSLTDARATVRAGAVVEVEGAQLVVCVTSSPEPLFPSSLVRAGTVVCSVGTHGLDRRELDPDLVRRSDVVVEGRASAMREAGNLIPARSVREWESLGLCNLRDLVAGQFTWTPGRPRVFSGVGMAWEDVVVARHVLDLATA